VSGAATFRGGLAVLSGPSGSGKSTICKALQEDPRVELSISATTRPPRAGEKDGREYWFHSKAEFEAMRGRGEFVEWAEVYGNFYGTPRLPLEAASRRRDRLMLLDIDVQGAAQLRKLKVEALYLFVAPPSIEELRRRLAVRATDSPAVIAKRLESAAFEMGQQSLYDHVLVNRDLSQTIARAKELLGL
jgi:guanylate kinase